MEVSASTEDADDLMLADSATTSSPEVAAGLLWPVVRRPPKWAFNLDRESRTRERQEALAVVHAAAGMPGIVKGGEPAARCPERDLAGESARFDKSQ